MRTLTLISVKHYFIIALLVISGQTSIAYGQGGTTSKSSAKHTSAVTNAPSEVITNKSVIAMHKAGLEGELVISKLTASACKFDMSTDGLVELKKAGVPDDVIKAMMEKTSGKKLGEEKKDPGKAKDKASQPELVNHPYYYNEASSTLKALEKTVAGISTKYIALGYGGVKFQYQIEGEQASLRILQDSPASFLVNTAGAGLPEMVLYKVKREKGKRSAVAMQTKVMGGTKSADNVIAFNTVVVSAGIYRITFNEKLAPGEYLFAGKPVTGSTTIDVYAFGID